MKNNFNQTELDRHKTISYIELQRDPFLSLRQRVERSEGLDAHLNGQYADATLYMNTLLEDLYAFNVELGDAGEA